MAIPANNNVRDLTLEQLRDLMTCPTSGKLFEHPVAEKAGVCAGHTFERAFIDEHLRLHSNCPISRANLVATDLIPNKLIREACRLLDPQRVGPLDEEDMDSIYLGAEALLERRPPGEAPPRVPQEIHDDIFSRIADAAKAKKEKCGNYYGCLE